MDLFTNMAVLLTALWLWLNIFRQRRTSGKLPPGPYAYPIIGNILHLGQLPHRSLAVLAATYGPLFSLQLGRIYTVVVTSSELAKEMMQKHHTAFSSRNLTAAAKVHDHHKYSVGQMPVGAEWRKLRKLCQEHLFCHPRLEASHDLRQEKIGKLREYIRKCCDAGCAVNIGEATYVTVMNLMSATIFSRQLTEFDSGATEGFRIDFQAYIRSLGAPNVVDFFPIFKRFDPQGIRKEAEFHVWKLLELFEDLINQRLKERETSSECRKKLDFLETLLDLRNESGYGLSVNEITHFLMDLFVAGVDTTMTEVEWAMTELLLNPEKLSKVKQELLVVIGEKQHAQESDVARLPYLQAVIKEVLRLHPPGPLLFPRLTDHEVEINGYRIPKGTQVFFNVWAISRDPCRWSDPESFKPDRFLESKVNFKGNDFEYIPFGAGKRICPGLPLADRMLHLMVAAFVHEFDWKLESNGKDERAEKFEVSLRKAVPLLATPIKHS